MKTPLTRRQLLKASAAVAGAAAAAPLTRGLVGTAHAQAAEKSALFIVFLEGGYNSLFGSADSFLSGNPETGGPSFGVTSSNIQSLGEGPNGVPLFVDKPTFGTLLPGVALTHMASIGIRHNLTAHEAAQDANWTSGGRSYVLRLAREMGGNAAIKAAVVGNGMPSGPRPAEGDVSFQSITDMRSTLIALGAPLDPSVPRRDIATEAMTGSLYMSQRRLARSPRSLRNVADGLNASVETLRQQKVFDWDGPGGLATVYNISPDATAVTDFRRKVAAAELMIRAGANVVVALDGGWDTHGDRDGSQVRNMMSQRILPPLATFIGRMMNEPGYNVVTVIMGEFARSLPGSDHQGNVTHTVIGKYVRVGTTGRTSGNVGLPPGTPNTDGFWAYLASVLKVPTQPFGANPHPLVLT